MPQPKKNKPQQLPLSQRVVENQQGKQYKRTLQKHGQEVADNQAVMEAWKGRSPQR
jgi:hypothetical protein